MKKKQGINYVTIDLNKVTQIRKILPLLKNRRTDIYPTLKA
jgi:predicted amidohydrolase